MTYDTVELLVTVKTPIGFGLTPKRINALRSRVARAAMGRSRNRTVLVGDPFSDKPLVLSRDD